MDSSPHETLGEARRLAGELAAAGWEAAAADARFIGARAALAAGEHAVARTLLEQVSRPRRMPVAVRIRAWHARALVREHVGDPRAAMTAVVAGLRDLERHRQTLGALELRAGITQHGRELAELGVRLALEQGRPRLVLVAAERARAAALRYPAARPPVDAVLAQMLANLRQASSEFSAAVLEGKDPRSLIERRRQLEHEIAARARGAPGSRCEEVASLDVPTLAQALGDRALVEYVCHGDRLVAVTLVAGRARLHELGSLRAAMLELDSLLLALRRLASGHASPAHDQFRGLAERYAARLDRMLLGARSIRAEARDLVLVPTGPLHVVPWTALPTCHGRAVTVVPAARLWLRAALEPAAEDGHAALVAGPGLPFAESEVEQLETLHEAPWVLTGSSASVAEVVRALDGAGLAHIAAHGRFRADNPLFSSLQLADGSLTVFDLESLSRPPRILVLTACDAGVHGVRPGDEVMGVVATLLGLGTTTVLASLLPLPDRQVAEASAALHACMAAGASPSHALAAYAPPWECAGLTCFGAG
jgi:hypothetical protein